MIGRAERRVSLWWSSLAAATLCLSFLVGCGGDNACVELGYKECDCCPAAQIDKCKSTIDALNDREPPDEQAEKMCESALSQFSSCAQITAGNLTKLCSGNF
jgi:hypothetical protein